ncbi:MAG: MBL fold metallo-hydrolase [Oscillospiraceae bacterium]|jgi:glyoxylase-like metal-dependent hydrolase (beta-lactamase superfamily II)|nr:MBL fold metallo-hydrolase [Oscillospiraceae bacterium]
MPQFEQLSPVEICPGVWNMTPGMANSYLVVGSEHALLIDTGVGRDDYLEQIAKITDKDVSLAGTHFHGDHTGSHDLFDVFHIGAADIPLLDEKLQAKAKSYEQDAGMDDFDFGGGETAEFIPLPGHTPGSYGVLIRARKLFFTGDMICNGTIFMIEGQCDFNDFIASMDKIYSLHGNYDYLVTCHGEPNLLPAEHALRQKAVAEKFLRGELPERDGKRGGAPVPGKIYADDEGLGFFRP